jgi:hypothetical protein
MSSNSDADADTSPASTQEHAVLLDTHDPVTVLETLPRTIFPVTARLKLGRTRGNDGQYTAYDEASMPVEPRLPEPEPYIPETTIYFDNPAERPPTNATAWASRECATALTDLCDHFESETNVDPDRLRLQGLCLAELPAQYLTTDNGHPVASPTLYEENGSMTLTYFQPDFSLTAHAARDALNDALPGQTRSPLQLTRLDEVTAKPARAGRETTQHASRCQYYTTAEAEKYNDLSQTPAIWKLDRTTAPYESARPLDTILSDLDEFCPTIADADLLRHVTFTGETGTRERFYADDVLSG